MTLESIEKNIERLKQRFKFNIAELQELNKIKDIEVKSISFTAEGGFDKESGDFHLSPKQNDYKVCIKYYDSETKITEKMFLVQASQPVPLTRKII